LRRTRKTNSKVAKYTRAKRPRICGTQPARSLANIGAKPSKLLPKPAGRLNKPGPTRGAKPNMHGAMREHVRAPFKTTRKSTFAKIRPRQFLPRLAWDLFLG